MLHLAGLAVILFLIFKIVSVLLAGPYFISLKKEFSELKLLRQALRIKLVLEQVFLPAAKSWQEGTTESAAFLSIIADSTKNLPNGELNDVSAGLRAAISTCHDNKRDKELNSIAQKMHEGMQALYKAADALVQAHTVDAPNGGTSSGVISDLEAINAHFEAALTSLGITAKSNVFSLARMQQQIASAWNRLGSIFSRKTS